jgi:amino-acid N-acetyltransferase
MTQPSDIRRGTTADLPSVINLLGAAGLPTSDLASISHLDLWVVEANDSLAGAIALERYGKDGLVRSLVVAPPFRNRGYGSQLVDRLEVDAVRDDVQQLVLLTETAEAFFRSRGYVSVERSSVCPAVKQSAEFRSLCPASARCLSKSLLGGSPQERSQHVGL